MAITAKFIADFLSFNSAVETAGGKLRTFEGDTKKAGAAVGDAENVVRRLGTDLLALFSVRAAWNWVAGIVASASSLKDLSQQTHINVEDLQILSGAMSEFGVDADTLGRGLFALSRKIAKGDDSVSDALLQMGMSLKEVQGLEGEELFLAIMRGLAGLQGSLRDTTASELFGSRLGMAMAGASEGIDGTLAEMKRLSGFMSTEAVDALDRYDESLKRAQRSLSAVAANMLGPVAEGFNVLFEAASKGASLWELAIDLLPKGLGMVGTGTEGLGNLIADLNIKTAANATATGTATTALRQHVPVLESTAGATKKAREETKLAADAAEALAKAYAKLMSEMNNAAGLAQMEAGAAAIKRAADNAEGIWLMEHEAAKLALASTQQARIETDAFAKALMDEALADDAARNARAGANAELGKVPPIAQQAGVGVKDLATIFNESAGVIIGSAQQMTQAIAMTNAQIMQLPRNMRPGENPFETEAEFTARRVREIAGGRASGGPVSAGSTYMVGERGPELFRPSTSGSIIPNGGGGGQINIYVTHPLGTPSQIAAAIKQALASAHMSGGGRMPA